MPALSPRRPPTRRGTPQSLTAEAFRETPALRPRLALSLRAAQCVLNRCLDEAADEPAAAAAAFTAARAHDARCLVRISRGFDGSGKLGTARFLLPLLLDIQLNKLLPRLFSPPMLRALQDERNSFSGLVRRKRLERGALALLVAAAGLLLRVGLASIAAWRRAAVGV